MATFRLALLLLLSFFGNNSSAFFLRDANEDSSSRDQEPELFTGDSFFPTTRIVGGEDAESFQAPWMALILGWNGTAWIATGCAGTLITNIHVLTAGHCAVQHKKTGFIEGVFVGAYQPTLGNPGVPFHFSLIESYSVHENYNDRRNSNDVALITLFDSVNTEVFSPVHLANASFPIEDGDLVNVFGFGHKFEGDSALARTLQIAELPYITSLNCKGFYPSSTIRADMICAGFRNGGVDACQGDSGGPATSTTINGDSFQIGIVSWGVGCARAKLPGVYANVMFFFEWIRSNSCHDSRVDSSIDLCRNDFQPSAASTFPTLFPLSEPTDSPVHYDVQSTFQPSSYDTEVDSCKKDGANCVNNNECCSGICNSVCEVGTGLAPIAPVSSKRGKKPKKEGTN